MLPRRLVINDKTSALRTKPNGGAWMVSYTRPLGKKERRETGRPHYENTYLTSDLTEAETRGKMLALLLENKLLTL